MTRKLKEILIKRIFFLFACVSILILVLIVTFLFREGIPIFRVVSVRDFLLGNEWYPTFDPPAFGIWPLIVGSFIVTVLSTLIAVPLGPAPFGRPCVHELTAGGIDRVSDAIEEARPNVIEMLREVRRRASSAAVYVVGYPSGLPQGGTGGWGRWPILDVDAGYIDAKMQEMNAMLASAAQQARVRFVDTYTSSLGHDACKPVPTTLPRVPGQFHVGEWLAACKGGPPTFQGFESAAMVAEIAMVGMLAIRFKPGVKDFSTIAWDSVGLKVPGEPAADAIVHLPMRQKWL